MWTISKLSKSCGLSRSTLLYYESIGLIRASRRTDGNYRLYGEQDANRPRQICIYRDAGLRLEDIRELLDLGNNEGAAILQRRLVELSQEIDKLRLQQRAIAMLMQNKNSLRRRKMMTKEKWSSIMRASGFSEDEMNRWHVEFERAAPDDHQQFLEYLHIPQEEIQGIRAWSQKG